MVRLLFKRNFQMKKIFTSSPLSLDFGLLLLRVLLAAGLLTHGIAKIANFSALSTSCRLGCSFLHRCRALLG